MANSSKWDPEYSYKENQHYKNYDKVKQKIKSKYPAEIFDNIAPSGLGSKHKEMFEEFINTDQRKLYQQYLRELADLIFEPNGEFQNLTWDMMSEVEKEQMERDARPKLTRKNLL